MPTPTPQQIADAVQIADDLASQAAGQPTDAEALAAKDAALSAMTTARDALVTQNAAIIAKLAIARTAAQSVLDALG